MLAKDNAIFIEDALRNRFEIANERRGGEIYEKMLDRFIEMIIECGTGDNTASSLIDNWLINAEHYTYEEIYKRNIKDRFRSDREKKREDLNEIEKEEAIEKIHDRAIENGHRYNDDLEETIAYWF